MERKRFVRLLYKADGQNANNQEPFVVLYDPKSWPLRITKKRGYDSMKVIFERECMPSEIEHLEQCWRMQAIKYKSIDGLIGDEVQILGPDHEEITVLKNFKGTIK